jgi:ribose transport system ATP-binding protein
MTPLLEAHGITKSFPGVRALEDVRLHVQPGEVLALIGENGAGKSTLMKILGGIYTPGAGTIRIDGQPVTLGGVKDAERHGIVLIHQELNLAEHLDVAANIFLGREPTWLWPLSIISPRIYPDAQRITERLGLKVSPRARVADLTVGQQQLVEIGRALSLKSRLLILDEPTSSLTAAETELLFGVLRQLKAQGLSMIYISHRLKEVEEIADRVTVLRDGKNAGELSKTEIDHDRMVRLMVGRELKQFYERQHPPGTGKRVPVLEVRGLRWQAGQEPISFAVYPGEIVGMAGLIGSGRTELAEAIFGVRPRLSGLVCIDGDPVTIRRPAQAIDAGLFLIPEDRRLHGLILSDSVKHNITLPSLELVSFLGLVRGQREHELAESMSERMRVRTPSVDQTVGLLSGGNQQKVVLAKWLTRTARAIIFDEPTRGIDVGAKKEVYALMDQLTRTGIGILMISSDLEEVLGISDRVLVMHEGRLAGQLPRQHLSEVAIMNLATGKGATGTEAEA